MKIKELPLIERPREKLFRYGVDKLTTVELIAILLGTGRKGENVMQLAKKVINCVEKDQSVELLKKISGLGPAKAASLVASIELGKRLLNDKQSVLILTPEDVWRELKDIRNQRKEYFMVFYLDVRNQIVKRETVSIGILNASLVHPREIFEPAIRDNAAQIILSHNHPSGVVEPSDDDIKLTNRLKTAGELLGIEVVDHIIVSKDLFLSFKEKQLL